MLEGIRAIGEAALERTPLVEALVDIRLAEQATQQQERDRGLIVTLDIHLAPQLKVEPEPRELDEQALMEVLWVGNASGSNSPQDRLTTDHPEYLTSQTVLNLLSLKGLPNGSELAARLQTLRDAVYLDLGKKEEVFPDGGGDQQYERYRWVWDLRKLRVDGKVLELLSRKDREELEALCAKEGVEFLTQGFMQAYARHKGKAKAVCNLVGKVLKEWVAHKLGVRGSQIKLYTLALEGEPLVRHPDYVSYIERKLVGEVFESPEAGEGTCHVCGAQGQVTADTTRFKLLKFYITDKPGFASKLQKTGFLRNYALCEECYRALLAGERFVENDLRTHLGRSTVYVIPTFHVSGTHPDADVLEEWAGYLKRRLAASETLEGWHEFQQQLESYQRFEEHKGAFVLHLLFATKGQAAVKVDRLIANVPPSRLDQLDEIRNRVRKWAVQHLGEDAHGEWDLSLGKLFYLLPLRVRNRQAETKPYLELLDALLVGRPLSVRTLIPRLLETACVHHFERYGQYVHGRPQDSDLALTAFLLQSQLFLCYLKELSQLRGWKGGEMMSESGIEIEQGNLSKDLRSWMDGLGLEGARRGLFLLGVLIGRIGSTREQYQSKKPILNKLHFQGMDRGKVMRLANEVYEKLRQYKIAEHNEGLYAAMKAHLDRTLNQLDSPQENVYWVLSGYAYATQQALRAGQLRRQAEARATEPEPQAQETEGEEASQ